MWIIGSTIDAAMADIGKPVCVDDPFGQDAGGYESEYVGCRHRDPGGVALALDGDDSRKQWVNGLALWETEIGNGG